MKVKFWLFVLTAIIVASLGLSACGGAATEAPAVVEEEEVATEAPTEAVATEAPAEVVATEAPVVEEAGPMTITYLDTSGFYTLDPHNTPWYTLTQGVMYDTLVALNPEGTEWEGILAESWEVPEDGLSLTFKLREGVTFHDGTPWNADAALWSFEKWLDPEWVAFDEAWAAVVTSVDKVDEMTIKVNFNAVYATLFADQVTKYFVSPTAYEELGADNFGLSPVGTGPYIPTEIVPNDHVTYKSNPDYTWGGSWTNGAPAVADFFEIRFNTDQSVAYAALETGEVTFTDLPPQFLPNAEENPDIEVNVGTSGSLYYLGINYKKEIFQNFEFRKAIAYAIEREEIVLAAFEGEAFQTCQYVPAGTPGYKADTDQYACEKFPYDPDMGNQILDELGWVDTNDDGVREADGVELVFPIIYNTEEAIGRAAEVIQGQLSDIGIALELNPIEAAAQAEILVAEQQDFFIRPYGYPDPVIVSWMVYYPNRNAYDDPGAVELGNAADASLDNAERMEAVDVLNRYLIDNAAWFPLWTPYTYVAYRTELKGAIFDFQGGILFHTATVE